MIQGEKGMIVEKRIKRRTRSCIEGKEAGVGQAIRKGKREARVNQRREKDLWKNKDRVILSKRRKLILVGTQHQGERINR